MNCAVIDTYFKIFTESEQFPNFAWTKVFKKSDMVLNSMS